MKKIIILTAATLIIAACSDNTPGTPENNTPVPLNVSATIGQTTDTRAVNSTWEAGDAIGIFMADETGLLASNRRYETAAGNGTFAPAAGQTIWFPIDDEAPKVDFMAYYPCREGLTAPACEVNVTDQTDQSALDLMTAEKITGQDKNTPVIAFEFRHRLVKMELTILPGKGVTATDLQGMRVSLTEQHTTGGCDFNTGAITPSGSASTLSLPTTAPGTFAEGTLLPAGAQAGRQLHFTLATDEVFRYTLPADRTFNGGEKHEYAITLNRTQVEVTASITDWVSVPGSGTAN